MSSARRGARCPGPTRIPYQESADDAAFRSGKNCHVSGRRLPHYRDTGVSFVGTLPALQWRVALPSARYEPRRPAEDILYTIVQAHFETFRMQAESLRS